MEEFVECWLIDVCTVEKSEQKNKEHDLSQIGIRGKLRQLCCWMYQIISGSARRIGNGPCFGTILDYDLGYGKVKTQEGSQAGSRARTKSIYRSRCFRMSLRPPMTAGVDWKPMEGLSMEGS